MRDKPTFNSRASIRYRAYGTGRVLRRGHWDLSSEVCHGDVLRRKNNSYNSEVRIQRVKTEKESGQTFAHCTLLSDEATGTV